jgi:ketosteroid isomerase-like protein
MLVLIGPLQGRTPAFVTRAETVEESMREIAKKIVAAYGKRDTVALKSFYAKQPGALFFWERKMLYSWDEINNTMDDLVRFVAKIKLTTGEFRAGGSGDTGWFATTFHADRVTPEGKPFSSDGRWTVVTQRIDGRWLIVHEHTSFPLAER